MMRVRSAVSVALVALAACGRHHAVTAPNLAQLSPQAVDSLWARAEDSFDHGHWNEAQKRFDQVIPGILPSDPRYPRLHFFLGEIQFGLGSQLQAVREFRRVADEQPDHPLAPEALLRAGDAYADLWRGPELDPTYGETAKGVYQEVATRYPGTSAAARAALRLNQLAERFALKEYQGALFYFRFKAYDSSILLFRSLIADYPKAAVVPDALEHLVRAYLHLGYQEDVKETCNYIAEYHPDPAGPRRFCPKPAEAAKPGSSGEAKR